MSDVNGPPWPTAEWVTQAVADGRGWADVEPEVHLDENDARCTLDFLRFLRDATSRGLQVNWRARLGSGVPISAIAHLPPPRGGVELALNPAVAVWRERFRPDSFVWRRGPGFVLLMDNRPAAPPRRGRLTDTDALALFHHLQIPQSYAGLQLEQLEAERVLLKLGPLALALPVRQNRPPIVYRRSMHTFQSAFGSSAAR